LSFFSFSKKSNERFSFKVILYDSDWNPQMDLQAQDRFVVAFVFISTEQQQEKKKTNGLHPHAFVQRPSYWPNQGSYRLSFGDRRHRGRKGWCRNFFRRLYWGKKTPVNSGANFPVCIDCGTR